MLVITESGEKLGVIPRAQALAKAAEAKKDLYMVSDGEIPVCKIMDYSKWRFENKKKKQNKKQSKTALKEIKFRPVIDEGDFKIKMKKIREFIADGHRVKIMIRFRGREIVHQSIGEQLVERILTALDGVVNVEQVPKLDGRQIVFSLVSSKR